MNSPSVDCVVYRCARQDQMYLYLRADLEPSVLPVELRHRTGALVPSMRLSLHPQRKLARVDVRKVMERLAAQGWYLQLPPDGLVSANLHFGD